jgi:hypothetical protein
MSSPDSWSAGIFGLNIILLISGFGTDSIKGKFKSSHNVSDQIANLQAATLYSLLKLADLDAAKSTATALETAKKPEHEQKHAPLPHSPASKLNLGYNIEVHLPAAKDIDVYNAIFKSLKEHLID